MRQEVNRADIGGKSGNKVKDYCVTIIRCLPSQIKENSLWSLLTYRKLFTLNTKIAVEFIITRVRDKDCVKNRVKRAKIVRFTLC